MKCYLNDDCTESHWRNICHSDILEELVAKQEEPKLRDPPSPHG